MPKLTQLPKTQMDLTVSGKLSDLASKLEDFAQQPQIDFLPHPLPSLDITDVPGLEVTYELKVSL